MDLDTTRPESDPKKKPYHHGDLRHALVIATRQLVEERGAAHFSVAQAARQAGVSSAAPYRHFKDREDMLDAVAEDGLSRLADDFAQATAPWDTGSVDAVVALGTAYIAFAEREPSVFRLMFAEHQNQSEAVCCAGDSCKMHLLKQVAASMGLPEPDAEDLDPNLIAQAFPFWALVHGISFLVMEGKVGEEGADVPLDTVLRASIVKLLGCRA